jgi:NADP-dependent 3-hydroxy acid dehydrogenase YdfG
MARLQGKVALVTGASAGIGRACARAFLHEGASLVLTARRRERLEEIVAESGKAGGEAVFVTGDAREEETAKAVVAQALKSFGRIDILVANAGMGVYKSLVDTSAGEYDEMMDTNVRATWLITRHTAPVMIRQREGQIVMVSSMAGVYGFAGEATYCASKFAQVGLAQGLDKELRPHGIKVGVLCPGGVKTEFAIGSGRTQEGVDKSEMMEAEDVAEAALFFCTQPKLTRIIEIQMRPMQESLT